MYIIITYACVCVCECVPVCVCACSCACVAENGRWGRPGATGGDGGKYNSRGKEEGRNTEIKNAVRFFLVEVWTGTGKGPGGREEGWGGGQKFVELGSSRMRAGGRKWGPGPFEGPDRPVPSRPVRPTLPPRGPTPRAKGAGTTSETGSIIKSSPSDPAPDPAPDPALSGRAGPDP